MCYYKIVMDNFWGETWDTGEKLVCSILIYIIITTSMYFADNICYQRKYTCRNWIISSKNSLKVKNNK